MTVNDTFCKIGSNTMKPLAVYKFRDHFVINGRRVGQYPKYGNYKTKAEAQEAAKQLVKDFYKGNYAKTSDVNYDKITVGEAYDQFQVFVKAEFENEEITLHTYEQIIRSCDWFVGSKFSNQIVKSHRCSEIFNRFNVDDFQGEFINAVRSNFKSSSTRIKRKAYIQKFINYTLKKGWATVNPLAFREINSKLKVGAENRDRSYLEITTEDLQKLYTVGLEGEPLFNKAIFYLGANTGVRQSEIRALRWRNVDFQNKEIYIEAAVGYRYQKKATKTVKGTRYIPIDDNSVKLLQQLKLQTVNCSENDIVFSGTKHDVLSKEFFRGLFGRAVKRSGMKHVTWASLRHYFASQVVNNLGQAWNEVADLMGHESADFTRRQYAFTVRDAKKASRQREAASLNLASL